jgi:hypothetical protein
MRKSERAAASGCWNDKELILRECLRYRALLCQVAERFLHGHGDANHAVNRCIVAATKTRVPMHSRGEFRSWILRLVIDEALQLLDERAMAAEECASAEELFEPVGARRKKMD